MNKRSTSTLCVFSALATAVRTVLATILADLVEAGAILEEEEPVEIGNKVELAAAGFDGQVEHLAALQQNLAEKLKAEIWVKPKVDLLPTGSLPVGEGKAKRVIDNRKTV